MDIKVCLRIRIKKSGHTRRTPDRAENFFKKTGSEENWIGLDFKTFCLSFLDLLIKIGSESGTFFYFYFFLLDKTKNLGPNENPIH